MPAKLETDQFPPSEIGSVKRQTIKELVIVASTMERVRSFSAWSPWLMPKFAEKDWTTLCEALGVTILDLCKDKNSEKLTKAVVEQVFNKLELAGHAVLHEDQEYLVVYMDTAGSHHKPQQPPVVEAKKIEDFNFLFIASRVEFDAALNAITKSPLDFHYLANEQK